MKCQILFSRKNMKNVISLLFAEFVPSVVSVKKEDFEILFILLNILPYLS